MRALAFPYNIDNVADLSIYEFIRPSSRSTASVFINMLFIKRMRYYRLGDVCLMIFA